MTDLPPELRQLLRRTRREAEAALLRAREESDAVRADLASMPPAMRCDPAVLSMLARLDELDRVREEAIELVAQGCVFG